MIDPWTAAFALNRAEKERLGRAVQERREIAKEIGKVTDIVERLEITDISAWDDP